MAANLQVITNFETVSSSINNLFIFYVIQYLKDELNINEKNFFLEASTQRKLRAIHAILVRTSEIQKFL